LPFGGQYIWMLAAGEHDEIVEAIVATKSIGVDVGRSGSLIR
jgi:hypothetical protein